VDLAIALGADGVHLGQDDLPLRAAREMAARSKVKLWLGKSTHSVAQALEAEKEGADYIGVGPVYETPTKPMRRAVGLDLIRRVQSKIEIPFVAIGGIDENRMKEVIHAGALRVAVVRAVFAAERVYETTKRMRMQIEELINRSGK
jgi:thiamine-phosphate pyrophosphorylase